MTKITAKLNKKNRDLVYIALWVIVSIFVIETLIEAYPKLIPMPLEPILLLPFAFIHGLKGYKWKAVAFFFVSSFIVSNIFENLSILTGFPFGHYHYTEVLGPKLFLVPSLVILAYIAFGYVCWVLSTRIIEDINRKSSWLITFAVPLVASFIMTGWNFCFDPSVSTIKHWWIWEQGGSYFGVPLTNFLGWSLTTYVFFQLFALYLRRYKTKDNDPITSRKGYYYMAVVIFVATAATFIVKYLFTPSIQVVDATGQIWQTGNIYETVVIASIYTMYFIAILAALRIYQSKNSNLLEENRSN